MQSSLCDKHIDNAKKKKKKKDKKKHIWVGFPSPTFGYVIIVLNHMTGAFVYTDDGRLEMCAKAGADVKLKWIHVIVALHLIDLNNLLISKSKERDIALW